MNKPKMKVHPPHSAASPRYDISEICDRKNKRLYLVHAEKLAHYEFEKSVWLVDLPFWEGRVDPGGIPREARLVASGVAKTLRGARKAGERAARAIIRSRIHPI